MRKIKNRDVLLDLLPKKSNGAEVGVLAGEYARKILEKVDPAELYLMDFFTGKVTSGDHNGQNVKEYDLDIEYSNIKELYKDNTAVRIMKGISYNLLKEIPENHLDFVYLDSDHTFDGTFIELETAFHKLKDGGYLCGHDYSESLFPDCKRAIDQFCRTYEQEIEYITEEDEIPSFAIRIKKEGVDFLESMYALLHKKGYTMVSLSRFRNLKRQIDRMLSNKVPGAVVETGTWKGGVVIFMYKYLQYLSRNVEFYCDDRRVKPLLEVIACDSFQGLPEPDPIDLDWKNQHASENDYSYLRVDRREFQENLGTFNIREDGVRILEGWFKDTLHEIDGDISLLRMDGDFYESTMNVLDMLYDKVSPGGAVLIDDYRWWQGCSKAVHDFIEKRGIDADIVLTEDDETEAWFIKKHPS